MEDKNINVLDQMMIDEAFAEEAFMLEDCENSVINETIEFIDNEEAKLNAELFAQHHKIST